MFQNEDKLTEMKCCGCWDVFPLEKFTFFQCAHAMCESCEGNVSNCPFCKCDLRDDMLDEVLLDSKHTFLTEQEEETKRCVELVVKYEELSVITEMIDVSCEIYERCLNRKKRMYDSIVGEDSSSEQKAESLKQNKKARVDNTEKESTGNTSLSFQG